MKPLRIAVVDLVAKGPGARLFTRLMNANYASVMPQAVAVWCEELGHEVRYVCYTGSEDLTGSLADETDVLIIGAFTRCALAAYAISNIYRTKGAITVLGGPHARCYPEDAARYFDYVLGFTGKPELEEILRECAPQRPLGRFVGASAQPRELPGVRERWKFIEATLAKAPTLKLIPMIGSMGCPYTCSFCIDAEIAYQPLAFDQMKDDLRFIAKSVRNPLVGWHDPNFGIRFDDTMDAIEEALPAGGVRFVAETSLSLLGARNLVRLKRNGFVGMLPGIESWYDYGNKSKATHVEGAEKVRRISEHVNLVLAHIPFVQTNFIVGLDCDEGAEPFELTRRFIDLTPGAFPAFSLFTCYGRGAPMNLALQRDGRVLPIPFFFLDSNRAMNVRPKNYGWGELYQRTVDLARYALSARTMARRFGANRGATVKALNVVRAGSSNRVKYQTELSRRIATDPSFVRFLDGETSALPPYYAAKVKAGLGPLWSALPPGALLHDPNAYLASHDGGPATGRQTWIEAEPAVVSA